MWMNIIIKASDPQTNVEKVSQFRRAGTEPVVCSQGYNVANQSRSYEYNYNTEQTRYS